MHKSLEFVLHHGYVLLLGWVFAEQIGLPLPSIPLLLAAGALAGAERMNFFGALAVVLIGSLAADSLWFYLGRFRGIRILQLICKISLEPDSCVRRTEGVFSKQGARSLLIAKFVPGLNTVAPPMAGVFHMKTRKFLLYDGLGSLLWGGAFLGLGFLFSDQIEDIAEYMAKLGGWLLVLLIGALAGYIAWKFVARQKFLQELRIARITPEELKKKIDAGEHLTIVDLRHSIDFEADPETIPGAFRMDAEALEGKNDLLPRDREIILYCT
jgi:membrane protein DedA with SNARE-associated domain